METYGTSIKNVYHLCQDIISRPHAFVLLFRLSLAIYVYTSVYDL